jgi:hypothetical protein
MASPLEATATAAPTVYQHPGTAFVVDGVELWLREVALSVPIQPPIPRAVLGRTSIRPYGG